MFQVCKENKKAFIKAAENKGMKNIRMKMDIIFGRSEEGFLFSSLYFKVYTFLSMNMTKTHRNHYAYEAT